MKSIDNCAKSTHVAVPERTGCCDDRYKTICRLTDISCIATFLRNASLDNLKEEERDKFLEFQSYFISLESKCFEEARFE